MRVPKLPYSRVMIELIHEIRHRMPLELRPGVRFSNPEILGNMAKFYHSTDDDVAQLMIEKLLIEAGGDWPKLLISTDKKKGVSSEEPRLIRIYRGQVSIVDATSHINIVAGKDTTVQQRASVRKRAVG